MLADRLQPTRSKLRPVVEVITQFDPFQMKRGPGADNSPPAKLRPAPVTPLQIAFASTPVLPMVIPFSINPSQFALVVVALGLAHVRIAALTICVGVKRPTGGSPLSPGGP